MEPTVRGPYADRGEAGRVLAEQLGEYAGRDDVVVLGLPRGGVPVAAETAAALRAPLDVLVVRKLGLPGHAELAMGAIAGVGSTVEVVRNDTVLSRVLVSDGAFDEVYRREVAVLREREATYRDSRAAAPIRGRVVIVVDDGLATGSTMRAAVAALRRQQPARLVVAVPAGAGDTCEALREEVDEVVCAWTPEPFFAVGRAYRDFSPIDDEQVRRALADTARVADGGRREPGAMDGGDPRQRTVRIPAAGVTLDGDLAVPVAARGVVVFAHGSGSSRHSARNQRVAAGLQQAGFATLLMDLLTPDEEQVDLRARKLRFDIPRLAARLTGAVDWLAHDQDTAGLPVATFGASTGAAAALITAAERPERVRAVISRGGRPDLAGDALPRVTAPTLLIVGGNDPTVLELNEQAAARLTAEADIAVVPGATHLFEEPGALEAVTDLVIGSLNKWLDPLH